MLKEERFHDKILESQEKGYRGIGGSIYRLPEVTDRFIIILPRVAKIGQSIGMFINFPN